MMADAPAQQAVRKGRNGYVAASTDNCPVTTPILTHASRQRFLTVAPLCRVRARLRTTMLPTKRRDREGAWLKLMSQASQSGAPLEAWLITDYFLSLTAVHTPESMGAPPTVVSYFPLKVEPSHSPVMCERSVAPAASKS
jgi:hypothetical protein